MIGSNHPIAQPKQAAMIDVDDLSFEYPATRALDRVSFRVDPGAIAALVGPNGAGKTTLLRCLAALERPFSGQVRIAGLDTQQQPRAVHAQVGYLPDFYGLYDELTVARSLFFAARAHGIAARDAAAAAERAAQRTELAGRMASKAGELSRGLRQRLAIGQAIVHEPRVLLLDEPAAGLDPQARRSLSRLLLSLQELGITQIVSSHILAELEDYCSHMLIMEQGRVIRSRRVTDQEPGEQVVRLELASPEPRFGAVLASLDQPVHVLEQSAAQARVVLPGHHAGDRAALLRALVEAGLEVASVQPEQQGLEAAYFADLAAHKATSTGAEVIL